MAIKKRCIRCRKHLREDGTCQNPDCVRFTPPASVEGTEAEQRPTEEPAD